MKLNRIVPRKRAKIVATLGPSTNDKTTLKRMIEAGLNCARLNFSHGDHEAHAQAVQLLREISHELGCPVAIIGDLRGPRIRVGEMVDGGVTLQTGQTFTLTPETCLGTSDRATVSYANLSRDLQVGNTLLLDDGSIQLEVTRLLPNDEIEGQVTQGGLLSSRRGINVPDVNLSIPPLTEKDLVDIDFAIAQHLDFLALSFVQSANDVQTLKTILAAKNSDIAVIAKIEMSGGLKDIEAIVAEADAVMVARGDMALEMSYREVPIAQKRIITTCRRSAVPVITATQMLESMISATKPTRAEVTDVANAIFDGSDALMLSGETAIGQHPVAVVETMTRIAARAEQAWVNDEVPALPDLTPRDSLNPTVGEVISYGSALAAHNLPAAAIVTYTRSGGTARRISRFRPDIPILVLTPNSRTYNQLMLTWGTYPVLIDDLANTDAMTQTAIDYAQAVGFAQSGDYLIITAGNPAGPPGNTNLLRIESVA